MFWYAVPKNYVKLHQQENEVKNDVGFNLAIAIWETIL